MIKPWLDEPNRVEFRTLNFPCLIRRVEGSGHLCGYVAVPPGHPWHGLDWDEISAEVHGGLTYASECSESVCHVPAHGESDDVWWIGFDCAHSGDLIPLSSQFIAFPDFGDSPYGTTYRTIEYVRAECESLARQAKEAGHDQNTL